MKRLLGLGMVVVVILSSLPRLGFTFTSGYSVKFDIGAISGAAAESTLIFSIPVDPTDKFLSIDLGSTGFVPQGQVDCFISSWTGEESVKHALQVQGKRLEGTFAADMEYSSTLSVRVQVVNPTKAQRVSTLGFMVKTGASVAVAVGKQPSTKHLDVTYTVMGTEQRLIVGSDKKISYVVLEGDKLVYDKIHYRVLRAGRLVTYGTTSTGVFDVLTYYYTDRNKYSQDYVVEVYKDSDINVKGNATFDVVYDLQISGLDGLKYLDTLIVGGKVRDSMGNGVPNVSVSIAKKTIGGFGGGSSLASSTTKADGSFAMIASFTDAARYVVKVGSAEYREFVVEGLGLNVTVSPAILYASASGNTITAHADVQAIPLTGEVSYRVLAPDGRVVLDWTGETVDPWAMNEPSVSLPQELNIGGELMPGVYALEARWDDIAKGNSTDIYDRTGRNTFNINHATVDATFAQMDQGFVTLGENKLQLTAMDPNGNGIRFNPVLGEISRLRITVTGSPLSLPVSFDSQNAQLSYVGKTVLELPLSIEQGGELVVAVIVSFAGGREEIRSFSFTADGLQVNTVRLIGAVGDIVSLRADVLRLDGLPANNLRLTWKSNYNAFSLLQADDTWGEPTSQVSVDGLAQNLINGSYTVQVKLMRADPQVEVKAVYSLLPTRTAAVMPAEIQGNAEPLMDIAPGLLWATLSNQTVRVKVYGPDGERITELKALRAEGAGAFAYVSEVKDAGPGFELRLSPTAGGIVSIIAELKDSGAIRGSIEALVPTVKFTGPTSLTDKIEREIYVESKAISSVPLYVRVRTSECSVRVTDSVGTDIVMVSLQSGAQQVLRLLPVISEQSYSVSKVTLEMSYDRVNWLLVTELPVKPMIVQVTPEYVTAYTVSEIEVVVTDALGNPLPGHKVTIIGDEAVTGIDGRIVLKARPGNTGDYYLRVETETKVNGQPVYIEKLVRSVLDNIKPALEAHAERIGSTNRASINGIATDNLGVSRVYVNDLRVSFDTGSGFFSHEVDLLTGENVFVVRVVDVVNNEIARQLSVVLPPQRWVIPLGKASPELGLDQPPLIMNGRTMLPFRWFGEQVLGAQVDYRVNGKTETVSLVRDGKRIELVLYSVTAVVDGKFLTLDAPATVVGGRTLVPARFLAELFGYTVQWDQMTNIISIEARQ